MIEWISYTLISSKKYSKSLSLSDFDLKKTGSGEIILDSKEKHASPIFLVPKSTPRIFFFGLRFLKYKARILNYERSKYFLIKKFTDIIYFINIYYNSIKINNYEKSI